MHVHLNELIIRQVKFQKKKLTYIFWWYKTIKLTVKHLKSCSQEWLFLCTLSQVIICHLSCVFFPFFFHVAYPINPSENNVFNWYSTWVSQQFATWIIVGMATTANQLSPNMIIAHVSHNLHLQIDWNHKNVICAHFFPTKQCVPS